MIRENPKVKIGLLTELASEYRGINPEKTKTYLAEALSLAQEHELVAEEMKALEGTIPLLYRSDLDSAYRLNQRLLAYHREKNDSLSIGRRYNTLALILRSQKKLPEAIEAMERAEKLLVNHPEIMAGYYTNLGLMHKENGNLARAIEYNFKSLELYQGSDDYAGIGLAYNNIGVAFYGQNDFEKALQYYQLALEAYQKTSKELWIISQQAYIAHCYTALGDMDKAQKSYEELLRLTEIAEVQSSILNAKCNLAYAYVIGEGEHQRLEKAQVLIKEITPFAAELPLIDKRQFVVTQARLAQIDGQYRKAISLVEEAIEISTESSLRHSGIGDYELMAELFAQLGNYRQAYHFHTQFKAVSDSLVTQNKLATLKVREAEFEYLQQEKLREERFQTEQNLAEQKIRFRNFLSLGLVLALLLVIGWGYSVYQKNQQGKKYAQRLEEEVAQRTQALSKANKNLEQANYELRTFNFITSHDIKEPIRGIGGHASLIYKKLPPEWKEALQENFDIISRSSNQLYTLLEDFSRYTSMSQNQDVQLEEVDLNLLITNIIDTFAEGIQKYKGQIKVSNLPSIQSNSSMLFSALRNLVENGLKFNRSSIPLVTITYEESEAAHHLQVRDNGIGVAPQYQDKIFGMFYRLERKDQYEGSGIGLSIAKLSVEKLEGEIKVKNNEEGGSTFIISIPKKKE